MNGCRVAVEGGRRGSGGGQRRRPSVLFPLRWPRRSMCRHAFGPRPLCDGNTAARPADVDRRRFAARAPAATRLDKAKEAGDNTKSTGADERRRTDRTTATQRDGKAATGSRRPLGSRKPFWSVRLGFERAAYNTRARGVRLWRRGREGEMFWRQGFVRRDGRQRGGRSKRARGGPADRSRVGGGAVGTAEVRAARSLERLLYLRGEMTAMTVS